MDGWRIASPIHNQCHHHGQTNKISIVVKTEDDDLNQSCHQKHLFVEKENQLRRKG